ncbi:MAG TPA: ROK family protein [Polyangia bacterium]|nr:ROK family protein [Polyangia bacterium]
MSSPPTPPISISHGSSELQVVTVDAYNAELRDGDGFIGDRASNRAFRAILDESRERIREATKEDPLGDTPTEELPKKKMDKLLVEGEPEAAGVIHGAIEEFATELTTVITRFLKLKAWRDTERIVVGGGLRASRVGELAIGRTSVLLKEAGHKLDLVPVHNHPDEAGLLGAIHLAPAWMLEGHDAILAVDIGGSNLRAGLVELRPWKASKKGNEKSSAKSDKAGEGGEIARGTVDELDLWRYADEKTKPSRKEAVERIGQMLERLIRKAGKNQVKLAPFIGVGCPGIIASDGHIERGGQNLPGNWESSRFNLPEELRGLIPKIDGHDTLVVMHNDAVVHGLSDLAYVQDVDHWGVLTIGTGLGNARFTNKQDGSPRK